jgi:hypothetical protein
MILVHHGHTALSSTISSVAGDGARPGVNGTFMMPFVSYATEKAWTISLNAEFTKTGLEESGRYRSTSGG